MRTPKVFRALGATAAIAALTLPVYATTPQTIKIRVTWAEGAKARAPYYVKLIPSAGASLANAAGVSLEPGEGLKNGAWVTQAGAGDADGMEFTLTAVEPEHDQLQDVQVMWSDLMAAADADTALRLSRDAAMHPASPRLTIQMNEQGTRGFTVTARQLRAEKSLWIPAYHVFISTGAQPLPFSTYQEQLGRWRGRRVLDRVRHQAEASYAQYASLWEDMGNPAYKNPQQEGPGQVAGLTWDSAIPKFGIDRGAGVWNDYGNPDHFQFWFDFGDLSKGIASTWKSQRLQDGLPVITTLFEKDGARYEVEQFAYPLNGPPRERRGDISMVLLERLRVTDLTGRDRIIPIAFTERRELSANTERPFAMDRSRDTLLFRATENGSALLAVSGVRDDFAWDGTHDYQHKMKRLDGRLFARVTGSGTREFVFKLPSPAVPSGDSRTLQAIDYDQAKQQTIRFWKDYIGRGARFHVPEQTVNELFNATLWHALRLPRRHGGAGPDVKIDLPYSNFAYSQTGTPWPVNQSVYVDYMLYGLRGYHGIATEELAAQYRNNQQADGRVGGFANWAVYTPGMLYAVAQNFLLSRDRAELDRVLPASLKALDWCLGQARAAQNTAGPARGLIQGPLNDLTGTGAWAFNQAYMYAGLELFGRVLEAIGNPRGAECKRAAAELHESVGRAFEAAAMLSPVVQLRDHTWQPYVPSEAHTHHRILDQWYPADVDTGAIHMIRLAVIAPDSDLSGWLLNDHEDNLYYKGLGMANEPVYNQQATAYVLRDDAKAIIRAFYSYMACAFSHTIFEPVEHRWTHGQYFGPPSTDGAWFELYRNMLIHERSDGDLVLGLATPRAWLARGKRIEVERAPTYFGDLSMTIDSSAAPERITAVVEMPARREPRELLVRLRHPDAKRMRSVTVNGRNWADFNTEKEWVRIPHPAAGRYTIEADY